MSAAVNPRDDAEARYRALFETMGPAVLLMRGPACIDCNPATLSLFGLARREEMLGKTPLDFAPEVQPNGMSSLQMVQQNLAEALRHGGYTFEWQSIRKGGEPFLMEVRFTPCGPPEEGLFLCIAVDISERRRAEEALRASEARFRAIVERAAEGILVADAETRQIRYANPEICRLLGFTADELLAMHVADLHPAEARDQVAASFAQQAAGTLTEASFPTLRKDGTVLEVSVRGARLELDGRPCVVGLFTNLTGRRLTEADRLRTQKLEALGSLAGGIAHDFSNLLQAVFGSISAAKAAGDLGEVRRALADSEQALQQAQRLSGQLLTFSRGGAPLKRVVAPGPIVERAARAALAGASVDCRVELAPELPAVEADESQLEQVVQGLVRNAAQVTPEGGSVAVAARAVQLPAEGAPQLPPGRYLAVAVTDTGAGLPAALLPRIFDPYFAGQAGAGGLGLATAHSVVRSHGGAVEVRSEVGRGSTFTVYLPGCEAAPPPAPAPRAARGARLLLMDDEPMIRKVTVRLLELVGHQADAAADGAEAVEGFRAARGEGRPYDLVILDLTVPGGMGGLEALSRLRAIDPRVRAVVSSGYSDDAAISEFRAHGFCAVLRKPYTLERLEQTLAEQLHR